MNPIERDLCWKARIIEIELPDGEIQEISICLPRPLKKIGEEKYFPLKIWKPY